MNFKQQGDFNSTHSFVFTLSAALYFLLLSSCGNEAPKSTKEQPAASTPAYASASPAFNSDSAFLSIEKQLAFGARVPNSEAHRNCGDYIVRQFRKYSDNVIEQKSGIKNFDGSTLNMRNIIAEINPSASRRIMICTHWDSRPYADKDPNPENQHKPVPAADDGASGVAVMIEMARVIHDKKLPIGIDFICFDDEDLGKSEYNESYCLGSQYWGKHLHKPLYKAEYGILLDMVGGTGAKFAWEEYSMKYAEPVLRKVWETAAKLGYSNYFYYFHSGGIQDDHYYVNEYAHIPTIDVIHYSDQTNSSFPVWHHTTNDNISNIDRNTLKAVGQTLLEVLYTEH
jgi:Zn-dependent M28 family amino/carboxypeptidase